MRDEIEHLLDDNEDMAQLYLTRKWMYNQQSEALAIAAASNSILPTGAHLHRLSSTRSGSVMSNYFNDHDVEDLEMLLEAYFMQLDGTRNKILSVSFFSLNIYGTASFLFHFSEFNVLKPTVHLLDNHRDGNRNGFFHVPSVFVPR